MFWIVFGAVVLVLLGVWVWADLRQPKGRPGNQARLDAAARSHTRNMYEDGRH
jgi:hypothetical protein